MTLLPPLIMTLTLSSLVGCAATASPHEESQACMEYRTMMTAPMPPSAIEALRKTCQQSRQ